MKHKKRPSSATAYVGLRLKEYLRRQIERSARRHGLSINAEITRRLEMSLLDNRYQN